MVERKSRFSHIELVTSKQADHVAEVLLDNFDDLKEQVYTFAMDNGNEFAHHEKMRKALRADVYFAYPYCVWERGPSENTNGLLRQYFLKGTNFKGLSQAKIRQAENRLNDRPRKKLGFRLPSEIFKSEKS